MQPARLDMLHDLAELGETTHRGAENRQKLEENEPDVDVGLAAGGCAACDQPPAARESLQRTLECVRADVFEDDIDAALVRESADGRDEIGFAVEDRFVGAELL